MLADFLTEYGKDLWAVDAGLALSLVRMLPPGSRVAQAVHGARAGMSVEATLTGVLVDAVNRLHYLVLSALSDQRPAAPASFFDLLDEEETEPDPQMGLASLMAIANGG